MRCVVLCRYASVIGESGEIGIRNLAEKLVNLKVDYSCIITGGDERARGTAEVIRSRLGTTPIETENELDLIPRDDSNALYKTKRAISRLLTYTRDSKPVIFVTDSPFIKLCSILFFGIKTHGAVPLAFTLSLGFPEVSYFGGPSLITQWRYETQDAYDKSRAYVDEEVGWVASKWRDRPSKLHGESKIVYESENWTVRTDVWKMDRQFKGSNFEILMAITRLKLNENENYGEAGFLRSIRDLKTSEHVAALEEIDRKYPDKQYVKYFQYPPFVWKLHIHIEPREHSRLPPRNAYLLKDVIKLVQSDHGCRDLLVYVPLTRDTA